MWRWMVVSACLLAGLSCTLASNGLPIAMEIKQEENIFCKTCEMIANKSVQALPQEKLESFYDELCEKSLLKQECSAFSLVEKDLATVFASYSQFCDEVMACHSWPGVLQALAKDTNDGLLQVGHAAVQAVDKLTDVLGGLDSLAWSINLECELCKGTVKAFLTTLKPLKRDIDKRVDTICQTLTTPANEACHDYLIPFVNEHFDEIVAYPPVKVCEFLGKCPMPPTTATTATTTTSRSSSGPHFS